MSEVSSTHTKGIRCVPDLSAAGMNWTAAISIAPIEASARFSLRLRAATAAEIGDEYPLRLDLPINTCIVANGRTIARLGPDEWLLLGPDAESATLARELNSMMGARFFSLVDIGHRQVAIAVSGTHAREVINGGCPLDLHDDAFPAGSATRTVLGKAEIVLLRSGASRTYRVECWRSFAPYVHSFLKEVAREFTGLKE